jgi:hypothetical protein
VPSPAERQRTLAEIGDKMDGQTQIVRGLMARSDEDSQPVASCVCWCLTHPALPLVGSLLLAHLLIGWPQHSRRADISKVALPGFNSVSVSDVMAGGRRISAPDEARAESVRLNAAGRAPNLLMRNGKRSGLQHAIR